MERRSSPLAIRKTATDAEKEAAGAITEDMLIDHLESRVGLYLGERN